MKFCDEHDTRLYYYDDDLNVWKYLQFGQKYLLHTKVALYPEMTNGETTNEYLLYEQDKCTSVSYIGCYKNILMKFLQMSRLGRPGTIEWVTNVTRYLPLHFFGITYLKWFWKVILTLLKIKETEFDWSVKIFLKTELAKWGTRTSHWLSFMLTFPVFFKYHNKWNW